MTSAGANTWSVPLELNNLESQISSGGGGGTVTSITAGNSNVTITGTATDPIISGTLQTLTSNVATSDFALSGNAPGVPSFALTGTEEFRVISADLTPHILVSGAVGGGVQLGLPSGYGGYKVTAPTVTPSTTSDTQVATTAFVQSVIGSSANVASVSGGTNINISGTANAPVVNLRSPLTSILNIGSQNISGTSGANTLTANATNIVLATTNTTNTITPSTTSSVVLNLGTGGVGRVDTSATEGNAQIFIGAGATGVSNSLRTEITTSGVLMEHETIAGTNQSMVIQSEGNIRMKGGYNSIINEVICSNSASGIVMNGAGLTVNSLAGTANTLNAGVNVLNATLGSNTFLTANTAGATNPNIFQSSGVESATNPLVRLDNTNATTNPAILELYKSGRNGIATDIVSAINFFGKDTAGNKSQFGGIESVITGAGIGNVDGAMDFYTLVNGTKSLVWRLNGADNENNSFRPLDMNGNAITTTTGTLPITTTGTATNIAIQPRADQDITLTTTGVSGNTAISASNGGNSCILNVAQDQFAVQTTGSIGMRTTGSSALSLQGQGSGGISLDAQFGGGSGDTTIKGSTVQIQNGASNSLTINSATGATFDLGGGAMNITGASTRTIQTTTAGTGLNIIAGAGSNGAILTLKSSPDQAIVLEGNSLSLNGTSMTSPSSGGSSGQHLQVQINGVNYVIALLTP